MIIGVRSYRHSGAYRPFVPFLNFYRRPTRNSWLFLYTTARHYKRCAFSIDNFWVFFFFFFFLSGLLATCQSGRGPLFFAPAELPISPKVRSIIHEQQLQQPKPRRLCEQLKAAATIRVFIEKGVLKTYIAKEREKNKRLPSFWENIWSFIGRKCAAQSRTEEEEEEESARDHFVAHEMKLRNEMKRPENNKKNRAGPHDELRSWYAITEKEKSV